MHDGEPMKTDYASYLVQFSRLVSGADVRKQAINFNLSIVN